MRIFRAAPVLALLVFAAAPAAAEGGGAAGTGILVDRRTGFDFFCISTEDPPGVPPGGGEGPASLPPGGGFCIGRYEVTQEQWRGVTGKSPSHFPDCADCPVETVSWDEVQVFLRLLHESRGAAYRLPTEEEWEYAAGGGPAGQEWPGTDAARDLAEFAWFSGSFAGKTRPVGLKRPGLFPLYDTAGNVAEWCADGEGKDSREVTGRERRAVRGGSWVSGPGDLRVSRRSFRTPDTTSPTIGFRVAADGIPSSAPSP